MLKTKQKKKQTKTIPTYPTYFFLTCLNIFFIWPRIEGWAQDCSNSNIFLKPLFRGNLDPFVNNANLGAIAHTSSGT